MKSYRGLKLKNQGLKSHEHQRISNKANKSFMKHEMNHHIGSKNVKQGKKEENHMLATGLRSAPAK